MRSTWTQNSFNGGIMDDMLSMRTDLKKYAAGAYEMENFIPLVQGPAVKRPGSARHTILTEPKDLFPFIQGPQTFIIGLGATAITVFYVDLTLATLTYPGGATITVGGGSNHFLQSNDVAFITTSAGMYELRYYSSTDSWTLTAYQAKGGPFDDINPDNTTKVCLTASAVLETSAATVSGGDNASYGKANTVDGNTGTQWRSSQMGTNVSDVAYIGQQFSTGKAVSSFRIYVPYATHLPATLGLEWSSDGSAWTELQQFTTSATTGWQTFYGSNLTPTAKTYWRLIARANLGTSIPFCLGEVQFYSAATQIIADAGIFTSADVGRLFYVENPLSYAVPTWEPAKSVTAGALRLSDGKVYKADNSATTGTEKPVHTEGAESDGAVTWTYQDAQTGYVRINTYIDAAHVTYTTLTGVGVPAGTINASTPQTNRWAWECWRSNLPYCMRFWKNRLIVASKTGARIWATVANDFYDFSAKDASGEVTKDMGVNVTMLDDREATIAWMEECGNLVLGTSNGVKILRASNPNEAFGPGNVEAVSVSKEETALPYSATLERSVYFLNRAGQLCSVTYTDSLDSFEVKKEQLLNPTMPTHTSLFVYSVEDGILLLSGQYFFSSSKSEEVGAWSKSSVSLLNQSSDALYTPVYTPATATSSGGTGFTATVVRNTGKPPPDDLIVTREEVGTWISKPSYTKRYMDAYKKYSKSTLISDSYFNAHAVGTTFGVYAWRSSNNYARYLGTAATILQGGLSKLDTSAVYALLQTGEDYFLIGIPYISKLTTHRVEQPTQQGTAQAKIKRMPHAYVRLHHSGSLKVGLSATKLETLNLGTPTTSGSWEYTGDKKVLLPGGYETDGRLYFVSDTPHDCTICGVTTEIEVNDR